MKGSKVIRNGLQITWSSRGLLITPNQIGHNVEEGVIMNMYSIKVDDSLDSKSRRSLTKIPVNERVGVIPSLHKALMPYLSRLVQV